MRAAHSSGVSNTSHSVGQWVLLTGLFLALQGPLAAQGPASPGRGSRVSTSAVSAQEAPPSKPVSSKPAPPTSALPTSAPVRAQNQLASPGLALHVLNRLGYGPRPGDLEQVQRTGVTDYIEAQLADEEGEEAAIEARLSAYPERTWSPERLYAVFIPDRFDKLIEDLQKRGREDDARRLRSYVVPKDRQRRPRDLYDILVSVKLVRAVHTSRPLREVMADFWFNHFNVYWEKDPDRILVTGYDRDVIRPRVFGRFRDLLRAVAQSPAMLAYLDNSQSMGVRRPKDPLARVAMAMDPPAIPQAKGKRQAGVNENYARELMELHTLGVDGGYTQRDVIEVARCFTGWTIDRATWNYVYRPSMHDGEKKMVLGHLIPAGGGESDGLRVLDILASHPKTARFLATKLCRRFVADQPPPALVQRVAQAYLDSDTDLRATLRCLFTSPEFLARSTWQSKIKTPLEFVVSSVRVTGGEVRTPQALAQALARMGMAPYNCAPPTGYADVAEAWINSAGLMERMSFALSLTESKLKGVDVVAARTVDYANKRSPGSAEALISLLLGGDCSPATRKALNDAFALLPQAKGALSVPRRLALLLGSPEFQRR